MRAIKDSFEPGTATISDFFYWINERHSIWAKRQVGLPKPWTDDHILRDWKFTNVFRQLDRGTIALEKMLAPHLETASLDVLVFNVIVYRLFNLDEHANEYGFITDREDFYRYLRVLHANGRKIFTSAHMTTGVFNENKVDTYIRACEDAWSNRWKIVNSCEQGTMEAVFTDLLDGYMIGRFVAYEIVCDLRFISRLWPLLMPRDVKTWANMGPGAARGLTRLGLFTTLKFTAQREGLKFMQDLYKIAPSYLSDEVMCAPVPFELREIEHSLCEFDKYQRVKRGEGQPRMKFNGRQE